MTTPDMPTIMKKFLDLMDELGPKYPDFMAKAVQSGNILGYLGARVDQGDPTALDIWKEMQDRGVDIMPQR